MLVLGLDPGLATLGYGLVDGDGQQTLAVAYGVITTPPGQGVAERLVLLHDELSAVLAQYTPAVAAVEKLFFSTNARTAIIVGEARGVILLTLAEAGVEIAEYTPLQVKQAITGYGQAAKSQMQEMVRLLLGLPDTPRPNDAADALAVAICHHQHARRAWLAKAAEEANR